MNTFAQLLPKRVISTLSSFLRQFQVHKIDRVLFLLLLLLQIIIIDIIVINRGTTLPWLCCCFRPFCTKVFYPLNPQFFEIIKWSRYCFFFFSYLVLIGTRIQSPLVCASAAKGGHLALLQWLRANDCACDARVCTLAAERGDIEVSV